ncbi:MAG: 16S rRNA (adenine(1518)-N(6)/adenine(1519)-N(6))-dimethyltransferase RsmA [bacterium]|nr:16S rRNA (adenine(1518)-N(6)/adenine(1519)-N(6))-dimethyltransferase RsmA [bacterium]
MKKSLGQNFLTSVGAINKIIASSDYSPGLTILEVGPGRGVLTEALLKKFDKVVAVEKDHELISVLQDKFSKEITSGQLQLIEGDILELTPTELNLANYAIVANIPYYITGQFLRVWLQNKPKYMVLMVQKEVAKRIVASDKKESLLSISVKLYGEPKYIETIKRGSFYPIPNVDSAILKITLNLETKSPSELDEERFFALLKAGFAHKRKLLLNNLKETNVSDIQKGFTNCNITPNIRAEDLTVENWVCLVKSTKR